MGGCMAEWHTELNNGLRDGKFYGWKDEGRDE